MKAAVLHQLAAPLRIAGDVICPELQRGQVLVKLAYSGVCQSQLMEVRGKRGADPYLPHLLGHEGTGRVVQIGDGVTKVTAGDAVILGWIKGAGLEGGPVRYSCGPDVVNAGAVTTFNEYAVVSENRITKLPAGVPMDVGVLFGCAIPTGAGIIMNQVRPAAGSTIAIFGLGGIGLSALMATQLFGCSTVIAVDVSEQKLSLARDFGATHTINAQERNPVDEIRKLTAGNGVDNSVDASGLVSGIETAFEAVRRGGGVCTFASHPAKDERICLDPYELICGKQIRGSWGGGSNPDIDIPRLAGLYLEGHLPLEKLITQRYPLDNINTALDDLEARRVGRPLIEMDVTLDSMYRKVRL